MKVLVLNGSPKMENSITLQTVKYIEQQFKTDKFEYVSISQRLKTYENNMQEIIKSMKAADLVLLCYPVYKYQVPYYVYRFMELLSESGIALSDIHMAQICTSKHFFDITATEFIKENCRSMNIKLIHTLSADSEDLLKEEGKKQALDFWKFCHYRLGEAAEESKGNIGAKIGLITDCSDSCSTLGRMIEKFKKMSPYPVREINLNHIKTLGGCLGCMKCGNTGECFYQDEFQSRMTRELAQLDGIVYAFTIKNHGLGSKYKLFEDRLFFGGHRPLFHNLTTGYLLEGELEEETNLKTIITASNDMNKSFIAGMINENCLNEEDKTMEQMMDVMQYTIEYKMSVPQTFYGVGGMKIFRDLVYENQFVLGMDHKYYKQNHFYDFPQKKWLKIWKMKIMMMLLKLKRGKKPSISELNVLQYKREKSF